MAGEVSRYRKKAGMKKRRNRVAGGIAPPGSNTTGHAGPRPAVPDRPEGLRSTFSLPC